MKLSRYTLRTSTRRTFRRCLRKWGYQSSMRQNLQRKGTETNIHFWFGSAIHFAMEDFFGYNKYGGLYEAFHAYYGAFPATDRPAGADEHYALGVGMLDYFNQWYPKHNELMKFRTAWMTPDNQLVPEGTEGARPLIEESFMLKLPHEVWTDLETGKIIATESVTVSAYYTPEEGMGEILAHGTYSIMPKGSSDMVWDEGKIEVRKCQLVPTYYHGTVDRIVQDSKGRLWIMDWKTAKSADTGKLDTDDQISAYLWAIEQWFNLPIYGFVYVQLTKAIPKQPKRLQNGQLSVDKKQLTTAALLKAEIIKDFGSVPAAPAKLIAFYEHLIAQEDAEGDRFIRWDMVRRSKGQKETTFQHILGEMDLMVNPRLHLFPNPTRDCIWDCPFREVCLLEDMQEEDAAQAILASEYEERPHGEDGNIEPWRENLPEPAGIHALVGTMEKQYAGMDGIMEIILPDKYK